MTNRLCEFINRATQVDLHREPGPQLTPLIQSIFGAEGVAIFDADLQKIYQAGEWFADLENIVRNIYVFETISDDLETGLSRRVLRVGNLPVGAFLLRGEIAPTISSSIADLLAITFDRYHSFANVNRTESARQTEQLRTTVLDSLAHAYKTPLTAIRVASTGLSEMHGLTLAQSELINLIDEQASILNELTTRLLKTAQLETHDLILHREMIAIEPVIDEVLSNCREQLASYKVNVLLARENFSLNCDRELLTALLIQYVDNAGKYAIPESTITIQFDERQNEVILSVHSFGPIISGADQERVFNRYFRCAQTASVVPGTGIGLSVAKRVAQVHGGDVWVTSDLEGNTTFFASLPIVPYGQ